MNETETRWQITSQAIFRKQYKNPDAQIKQRVDHAIEELKNSDNSIVLGRWKKHKRVFAYNVGKYRITYSIDWDWNVQGTEFGPNITGMITSMHMTPASICSE